MSFNQYPVSVAYGKNVEVEFKKKFTKDGFTLMKSSKKVDMIEHWDFEIGHPMGFHGFNTPFKVDVKGIKAKSRNGALDDSMHWLEIKNIGGGHGWLWGKADGLAFETLSTWIIVDRKKLQRWVANNIPNEYVSHSSQAYMKLYTREKWGKKDVITIVDTDVLRRLGTEIAK